MTDGYFLTPDDRRVLDELIARVGRKPRNTAGRTADSPGLDVAHELAPEVYVARSPAGGIPALDENATTWTGTGTLTHSGTGTELAEDDAPGYADCLVWMVIREDTVPVFTPVDRSPFRVYNYTSEEIPGNTWGLVVRDKHGSWWWVTGGGGALVVCGDPKSYEQGLHDAGGDTGTGSNEECPVWDAYEQNATVDAVKFWYEDFVVTFEDDDQCGGGATGTGSGSGTGTDVPAARDLRRTAKVKTRGYTGVITVGDGNVEICSDCSAVEGHVFICVVDGLITKTFHVPDHCP